MSDVHCPPTSPTEEAGGAEGTGREDHQLAVVASLEAELAAATTSLRTIQSELSTARTTNSSISEELAEIRSTSANAIELRDQNEGLRRRNNELAAQIEALEIENSRLANRSRQNWFIVGALVLAAGIVVGLVAPSLRRRRRSDW